MTISLARRQKLAAIAKAHDTWVDEHLADVSPEFAPADYPKPGSDYNQHNLDVDASGEAEDELALMLAGVLEEPMTAAGDPDWDESEHPRGPDGKFIEDGSSEIAAHLKKKIAEASIAKNIAYMSGDDYEAQTFKEVQEKLEKQLKDFEASPKLPPLPPAAKPVSPKPLSAAGNPITAWTKTIYSGTYADGEIVANHKESPARLVWNAGSKKFDLQQHTPSGGWKTEASYTKKGAYTAFKENKKDWLTPNPGTAVVDSAPPPKIELTPTEAAVANGDFSGFKQVGPNAGTTPGGIFEAPDGSRWYIKGQKSAKHANNEALASAFYRAAGIDVPEVVRGKGTPGLPGNTHTATRMVEGANQTLPGALGNADYIKKIREGFALDAWLANWDVVGEGFENPWGNIIEGSDGKPHRIDVGGALLFRGLGTEKGSAFGSEVTEYERMRNTSHGARHAQLFEGMDDAEIAASVARVEAISPTAISKLVSDYDMDISLAELLIQRRENILAKSPKIAPKDVPAPAPAISTQKTGPSTTWTKKKFTQTTAYKTSYADGEIVGVSTFNGADPVRIVWSNGSFREYTHTGTYWQYSGSWTSKKKALDELKDKPFYVPPKGTMATTNNDFIPGTSLISGNATIVKTAVTPDVNAVPIPTLPADQPTKAVKLKPFEGGAFWPNIDSQTVWINGVHSGAIHQKENGKWKISVSGGKNNYLVYDAEYDSQGQAAKAFEDAHNAHVAAGGDAAAPYALPAPAQATSIAKSSTTKKTPKLTVAQIEKQNGSVPKTLTHTQKSVFLKDLKEDSPVGFVKSGEENTQKVFIALVHAVNKHNENKSPKLNYLQGANLLDQTYGSKQKESLVKWLRTAEGKAQAPGIISGAVTKVPGKVSGSNFNSKTGNVTVVKVNTNFATVSSPYELGTPKKIAPGDFQHFSLSDATDMHLEMDKNRPLTVAQQKVVKKYTQSAFPFNQPLRGTGDNASFWDPQAIADLQSAMRPVTQSFTVTRMTAGLGSVITSSTSESDIKKFQGAVISDPAFLSTSIPGGKFSSDRFKLEISVPEGTPAVWAYHYGEDAFEQEREMLLAAGLHYRIDKIDPPTGSGYERKIYLTVVPEMKVK